MDQAGISIDYVALEEVEGWPRNPKGHDLGRLGRSFERFGFTQPLLRDEKTGRLVAGHGRLEGLRQRKEAGEPPPDRIRVDADGRWLVPVLRGVSFATDAEAEAYLLADNRLVELGGWEEDGVAAILANLPPEDAGDLLGYSEREASRLLSLLSSDLGEEDPIEPNDRRRTMAFQLDESSYGVVAVAIDAARKALDTRSAAEALAEIARFYSEGGPRN